MSSDNAQLWLSYATKVLPSLGLKPSAKSKVYIAPLSAAGIAAGTNIPPAVTNQGIFVIGDTLLDPTNPMFLPGTSSYSQRLASYLASVQLPGDLSPGTMANLTAAQKAVNEAQLAFNTTQTAAVAAWKAYQDLGIGNNIPFSNWFPSNYPGYGAAKSTLSAATQNLFQAQHAAYGSNADILANDLLRMSSASDVNSPNNMNMPTSTAPASVIADPSKIDLNVIYRPLYSLQGEYADVVDGWMRNFPNSVKNPGTSINFKYAEGANQSWSSLGFTEDQVKISDDFFFFSSSYTKNNQKVTKNLKASDFAEDISLTVTFTGYQVFTVTPGAWNVGDVKTIFPTLSANAPAPLNTPMELVSQVAMAYGVGMVITMSESSMSQLHDYLQTTSTNGGSASIFGWEIGGGAGSTSTSTTTFDKVLKTATSTTITIPAENTGYPVLVAAVAGDSQV
ncbi:hypothetical protein N0V82_005968 [Gnomoniopsis sp. IMI 355080]|nr:hypothetical protein N0V82_005968 [Gnomoniopsis sp. IMI 355080]